MPQQKLAASRTDAIDPKQNFEFGAARFRRRMYCRESGHWLGSRLTAFVRWGTVCSSVRRLLLRRATSRTDKTSNDPCLPVQRSPQRQAFRNASRSALIVSACVVGIPCGKLL
jgi:hypothetical protein